MPLLTLAEAQELLQITDQDALITTLLPIVTQKVVTYCNNYFLDLDYYITNNTMAFVNSGSTITDSDDGFVDAGFASGNDVRVKGSKLNDRIIYIKTVAAGVLTAGDEETIIEEANDSDIEITLTKVVFPIDLKVDAANLLYRYMVKSGKLVQTETLPGGYSVKFTSMAELMKPFNLYRRPFV